MPSSALEAVRLVRGLTQGALASATGVTQSMISMLESGHTGASKTVLDALAAELDVPARILQLPAPPVQLLHSLKDSVSAKVVNRVTAEFTLAFLRAELVAPGIRHTIRRTGFPDDSGAGRAEHLRRAWTMPPGPVKNFIDVLESHGIVCLIRDLAGTRVNALAATSGRWRALMFIDPRPDREDALWAVAHELGHLVSHEAPDVGQEDQADEFAGEFLAPRKEVKGLLDNDTDPEDLPDDFLIPPPSFAVHARRHGLVGVADYRSLRKQSPPPQNRPSLPAPRRIAEAVQERVRAGESIPKLAKSAFLSEGELRRDYL